MKARNRENTAFGLSDRRLLSIEDFCDYASVGRNVGMDMAKEADALFKAGRRVLIDRVKFDHYCDQNSEMVSR
jgi:hypothetical protein